MTSAKLKPKKLRSHFTRETTAQSLENSLTIDTRLDTESELGLASNVESGWDSRKASRIPRQKSYLTNDPQQSRMRQMENVLLR